MIYFSDADEYYLVTTENEPKAISGAVVDGLAENNDFDLDEGLTNWHSPRHDTATVDTSTTNTVNNDDSAPEASKEANGPEVDDFAEIDWHEDPSEQEPLSSVTTSASKRVRTDDELDLADNKSMLPLADFRNFTNLDADVKRQRS